MAESKEEQMDEFAAQCWEHYDCGSSIDSSDSNDIVIWSLTGPPTADYKIITDEDSDKHKKRLQNQECTADDNFVVTRTPMSKLLNKNFDPEYIEHVEPTCNVALQAEELNQATEMKHSQAKEPSPKGGIVGKFKSWLERKMTAPSRSLVKNLKLF